MIRRCSDTGSSITEYALIVAMIAAIVLVVIGSIGIVTDGMTVAVLPSAVSGQ